MFNIGDNVILVGPTEGEQSNGISWLPSMEVYVGTVGTISYVSELTVKIKPNEYIPSYSNFFYDKRWVKHISEYYGVDDEFEIEDLSSIIGG